MADEDMGNQGEATAPSIVEDERVWMDDGNIVVSAGKNPRLLFKCHWSMLATMPLLNGMSSLSHLGSEERYQGLPVLPFPDPPEDVRALLRMLYDGTLIPHELRAVDTVARIGGAMRLAKKYDIGAIFMRLSQVLKNDWPHIYSDWEHTEERIEQRLEKGRPHGPGYDDMPPCPMDEGMYRPDPAEVIRLAQDVGLMHVLPAAFYELHKWYPEEWPPPAEPSGWNFPLQIHEEYLSATELRLFIRGKARLQVTLQETFDNVKREIQYKWKCTATLPCKDYILILWEPVQAQLLRSHQHTPRDPLAILDFAEKSVQGISWISVEEQENLEKICMDCRRNFSSCIGEKKVKIWNSLPTLFGIEDAWSDL